MNKDEEKYVLTPKGIFSLALVDAHLVEDVMDWRIDAAWRIFELIMKERGYMVEEDDGK